MVMPTVGRTQLLQATLEEVPADQHVLLQVKYWHALSPAQPAALPLNCSQPGTQPAWVGQTSQVPVPSFTQLLEHADHWQPAAVHVDCEVCWLQQLG